MIECVDHEGTRSGNLVPGRNGKAVVTALEQLHRFVQVLLHLDFGYIRDQDVPLRKMVKEAARISSVIPDHHRAVFLAGQYGFEFGDYLAIGFWHRWLLRWSNNRRGSSENNAEQSRRLAAEMRGFHAPVPRSSAL